MIFAVDPGNVQSAYVSVPNNFAQVYGFGKIDNTVLIDMLVALPHNEDVTVAIEMIACYGQRVGREVFETCVMIGRIAQKCDELGLPYIYIFRKEEMQVLCEGQNNGDSGIRRALIERYARHDLKNGKGTKKNPDFFYGFSKDVWAAMAVAVACNELHMGK